jgi:hypothetical protein
LTWIYGTVVERKRITTGAGKHRRTVIQRRVVRVATRATAVAAGRSRKVTMRLNAAGLALLARAGRTLAVTVDVTTARVPVDHTTLYHAAVQILEAS